MKTMHSIVKFSIGLLFPLTILQTQIAQGAKSSSCGKLPSVAVEDLRNIKAGHNNGQGYDNAGGHGGTKLPAIGKNQHYQEYDVDANNPNPGNRGKYRFVAVITTEKSGKIIYDPIYFTQDHYKTFCKV